MCDRAQRLRLWAVVYLSLSMIAWGGEEPNQAETPTPSQGLLWRVDSGSATVHLLGVIHVGSEDLYPSPAIETAFGQADVLVQEMKIDQESQLLLHKMIFEIGVYPPGERLEQHLSADVLALYEGYLQKAAIDPNSLTRFRPWVVAWMITMSEARRLGYSYNRGVSTHLFRQAQGKKEIVGLETPADYADLFKSLPSETQEALLQATLAQTDDVAGTMKRMIDVWRRGDWRATQGMMQELYGGPALTPFVQSDRDRRMTAKIEEYLKTNRRYFITVGAGHLVGQTGILERLRRRGHTIRWLGPEEYAVPDH